MAENREKKFWDWFDTNQNQYLFLAEVAEDERDRMIDELVANLHAYNANLYFALGGFNDEQALDLIITAEGVIEHFDAVETLVQAAPVFKNWNIIAFKPPRGIDCVVNYRDHTFDPDNIYFIALHAAEATEAVGIHVCYDNYTDENAELLLGGTYVLLDSLLGEKGTALDLKYMDVIKAPADIENYEHFKLSELPAYISNKSNL